MRYDEFVGVDPSILNGGIKKTLFANWEYEKHLRSSLLRVLFYLFIL